MFADEGPSSATGVTAARNYVPRTPCRIHPLTLRFSDEALELDLRSSRFNATAATLSATSCVVGAAMLLDDFDMTRASVGFPLLLVTCLVSWALAFLAYTRAYQGAPGAGHACTQDG